MYQVIILDDDPMAAEIERNLCVQNPKLQVQEVFSDAIKALRHLQSHTVDLVVMDYQIKTMDVRAFLHRLRAEGRMEDVILVTAMDRSREIADVYAMGILDYVIKPFGSQRFHDALRRFITKRETLGCLQCGTQETIDLVMGIRIPGLNDAAGAGLRQATLRSMQSYMAQNAGRGLSMTVISQHMGLSRSTVQKYLRYMQRSGTVVSMPSELLTGARRNNVYTYVGAESEE